MLPCPSKTVIRSVLAGIDGDEMDRIAGKGCSRTPRKARRREWEIALDGKVMRVTWTDGNGKAVQGGILLKALDTPGISAESSALVTPDAAHTWPETARASGAPRRSCRAEIRALTSPVPAGPLSR